MTPRRKIISFFIRLPLIYVLLTIPWPGLQQGYARVFRAATNFAFASVGQCGSASFHPHTAGGKLDSYVLLRNHETRALLNLRVDARRLGYLPTAFLIALILATPVRWARRWPALLWGLLLVNGFVWLRVALFVWRNFAGNEPWALYDPGPVWIAVLDAATMQLARHPASYFTVPLLIWLLVTFGPRDWFALFGQAQPGRNTAPVSRRTARWGRAS